MEEDTDLNSLIFNSCSTFSNFSMQKRSLYSLQMFIASLNRKSFSCFSPFLPTITEIDSEILHETVFTYTDGFLRILAEGLNVLCQSVFYCLKFIFEKEKLKVLLSMEIEDRFSGLCM